jgi:serine/threonine protein kinase
VTWLSDAVLAHLCDVAGSASDGGRYELAEEIGRGGMGIVYRAHDRVLDRPVALKVLHGRAQDAGAVPRLEREARILARLEHPGIVPVHDAGVLADGRRYYAMKLVRGKRLDEQVSLATPLAERLGIFQKVCESVAFAHAHGVLHRDLKPQNVMLGPFGEVLVVDWGLAKQHFTAEGAESAEEEPVVLSSALSAPSAVRSSETLAGQVLGTPGYMAPEQARGEVDLLDKRTDVYGLGGILYFLLTGQAPDGAPPRRHERSLPRPLEAICRKALAPARADRYADVPELAGDVAAFLAGLPVRAYPEGVLGAARRLATKYRTAIALVVAYLLMRLVFFLVAAT